MNTLLNLANGALQYQRGKHTGLAGLFGLAFALFCVFKWELIYPILDKLGIVGFFDKLGLMHHGAPGITGFNILMFFYKLYIFLVVFTVILFAIVVIFGLFFSSDFGLKVVLSLLAIIAIPFALIFVAGRRIYYFFNKEKKDIITAENAEQEKDKKDLYELLDRDSQIMTKEQALSFINRLPTFGEHSFLLGITYEKEVYMIVPRPINFVTFRNDWVNIGDLACEKLNIRVYDRTIDKSETGPYIPTSYVVSFTTRGLNLTGKELTYIHESMFEKFLLPFDKGIQNRFQQFTYQKAYKEFTEFNQHAYFERKKSLTRLISEAPTKEEFNRLVKEIKYLDANNEDIVKMMCEVGN